MEDRIRKYVEDLFSDTAQSKRAVELKEEMIQNCTDKYHDLLAEGKTPEAAFNIVVAGIGDVSGLLKDLEYETRKPEISPEQRQKSAMLTAVAVMLYILCVLPLIILELAIGTAAAQIIGIVVMFVMAAAATGLLIYNSMTKPRHVRADDTMVDSFRQWQAGSHEQKALMGAIRTALWTITVALYFILSFLTGWWHLTWLVFLLAVAVNAIINAVFALKK